MGLNNGLKCNKNCLKNKYGFCKLKQLENLDIRPNFKIKDNVRYHLDKSIDAYILWEDYKAKFNRKRTTKDTEKFINTLKSLDLFQPKNMGPIGSYDIDNIIKIYPTFRTQDSSNWVGARGAFEQSLVDNNINWFTYIKFYINTENNIIRPLVVGKSGSLNVNSYGSDISFSEAINDGPARRYLLESNGKLIWDKTQILIIKAKSEKQALFYENRIVDVFDLFES